MHCAISGEVPEEPMVSIKSGHIFEKRLILKYLQSESKCPITGNDLGVDDLKPLQTNKAVKPRPLSATNIPGLINLFQNEWDDLMLETFTLKQHLDSTRQQLSQALYQHDAACRVIARLIRERDEMKMQLTMYKQQIAEAAAAAPQLEPPPAPAAPMEVEEEKKKEEGITESVLSRMTKKWKQLSKERKKRGVPDTLATPEVLQEWDATSSHTVHKSDKPGILCLDIHPTKKDMILTGGVDKDAILFNKSNEQVVATLSGHSKRISDCCFHPFADRELVFTASGDKTTKIWSASGDGYECKATLSDHAGEVIGVSVHATGDFLATASRDRTWAFYSIASGGDPSCLKIVKDPAVTGGFECVSFHPDGLILGTGTSDALIRIWDMKTQTNVASFEGHTGIVHDIAFSENGYYMASAGEDGSVRMWDLRRLKNFYNIETGDSGAVNCVSFDHSGSYLACGSNDVRLFVVKEWTQLATLTAHRGPVTDLKFGDDAKFLATTSMDRSLKFFGENT
mmetsp:Transcript_4042/g.5619  ORF Transcript_4042/g.5619 Transcript_4042/m.5619 type:complete len:511 (+) Transcript_4042:107-1639(+)|eukprot:CAMPEP_0117755278 /NCGR_PEP_ID=MMETSP0947-20121206/13355_1 /TAXON_ID=44440 /ORGANISM="Chattonella subsalsa, Strain CCMP2191" /LENGTH=510 /DNA_ID=CAMNT_0005574579 /DNA_START=29 /DNA_END=1561 /DNA_ORIENTATION=+